MHALTISQPSASLIASGEMWVDNRTWETSYRGILAIHAGSGTQYLDRQELREMNYPTGVVVAIARLTDCVRLIDLMLWQSSGHASKRIGPRTVCELLAHKHTEGPFLWVLSNVIALPSPIAVKGQTKLWEWDAPGGLQGDYEREVSLRAAHALRTAREADLERESR
ncbi:MAG: hypothetical protein ACKVT0_03400 [Planctomycetaceae bacterium]